MKLTVADLVVLSVLIRAGPMHGYEVWQRLDDADVRDWARVSRPQVYYSLRKLAETTCLERAEDDAPSRGPERATFRATDEAKRAVGEALEAAHWTERAPPDPFLTWAALALTAGPATIHGQIGRYRAKLSAEIERERSTLATLAGLPDPDVAVGRALASMAIRRMEADLASLDGIESALAGTGETERD